MIRITISVFFMVIMLNLHGQQDSFMKFLADSSMTHADVSFCITDSDTGGIIFSHNSSKSLIPASVIKLITTSTALELMGPYHTFSTAVGYTGTLNKRSGILTGDIIITGGGDPVLGSKRFEQHYAGFADKWVEEIKKAGIRKIKGRVITDDSYFDYLPVPSKWLWEDAGNYYGAGAYGLSVYDNTYEIHFRTTPDSASQLITSIVPEECRFEFSNWLVAAGTADKGYVFAAPYSTNGWLAGTIPEDFDNFYLKASIADPPLIMAKVIDQKLRTAGIIIRDSPSTARLLQTSINIEQLTLSRIFSPPLHEIIEVLNHQSVNLYAEHLAKELGKKFLNSGSTEAGIEVITRFLKAANVRTPGMFLEDGSGLSPLNAINSLEMTRLLLFMKTRGTYFDFFYSSLPDAGKEGTMKINFRDPVFETGLKAKSGSMTRVRSFAGYLTAISGKELIFCIIVNNFTGAPQGIITAVEEILKETILNN